MKQTLTSSDVRNQAFCERHTLKHSSSSSSAMTTPVKSPTKSKCNGLFHQAATAKQRSNKEIFELEQQFHTLVDVAAVDERLKLLKLTIPQDIVQLVFEYWKLKRRGMRNQALIKPTDEESLVSNDHQKLVARMQMFIHLRHDLERIRNMAYLLSRREKLKRSLIKVHEEVLNASLGRTRSNKAFNRLDCEALDVLRDANRGHSIYEDFALMDKRFDVYEAQRQIGHDYMQRVGGSNVARGPKHAGHVKSGGKTAPSAVHLPVAAEESKPFTTSSCVNQVYSLSNEEIVSSDPTGLLDPSAIRIGLDSGSVGGRIERELQRRQHQLSLKAEQCKRREMKQEKVSSSVTVLEQEASGSHDLWYGEPVPSPIKKKRRSLSKQKSFLSHIAAQNEGSPENRAPPLGLSKLAGLISSEKLTVSRVIRDRLRSGLAHKKYVNLAALGRRSTRLQLSNAEEEEEENGPPKFARSNLFEKLLKNVPL